MSNFKALKKNILHYIGKEEKVNDETYYRNLLKINKDEHKTITEEEFNELSELIRTTAGKIRVQDGSFVHPRMPQRMNEMRYRFKLVHEGILIGVCTCYIDKANEILFDGFVQEGLRPTLYARMTIIIEEAFKRCGAGKRFFAEVKRLGFFQQHAHFAYSRLSPNEGVNDMYLFLKSKLNNNTLDMESTQEIIKKLPLVKRWDEDLGFEFHDIVFYGDEIFLFYKKAGTDFPHDMQKWINTQKNLEGKQ